MPATPRVAGPGRIRMPAGQPIHTVEFTAAGCRYDIRVNDAPFYASPRGLPGTIELPTNGWIRRGENLLSFRIWPMPGQDDFTPRTRCSATVYRLRQGDDRANRKRVMGVSYVHREEAGTDPKTPSTPTIGPDGLHRQQPFGAAVPFKRWAWFDAPEITDPAAADAQLRKRLAAVHQALAAGGLDDVLAQIRLRDEEAADARYIDLPTQLAATREDFRRVLDDPSWTLRPLVFDDARLVLYGGARLARIENRFGLSPLYFVRDDLATYFHFVFMKGDDGGWIVCR